MGSHHPRLYRGSQVGACIDDAFPPELVDKVREEWPLIDAVGWLRYSSPLEQKWTRNKDLPDSAMILLGQMAANIEASSPRAVPDLSLHGSGLSMMGRGDKLDCHYDAELHPKYRLFRLENAILFIDDWDTSWGGQLEVWDDDRVVFSAYPKHNRLVLFDATRVHSVHNPLQCPEGIFRKAVSLYWWGPWEWTLPSDRPRALFLPSPGAIHDEQLSALRRCRSQLPATKGQ